MKCDQKDCHYYDNKMTDNCSKGEPPNVEGCENRRVISWCPQCGPNPGCDEDGCCGVCGCDVGEIPDYITIQEERDAAIERAEKAEAHIDYLNREIVTIRRNWLDEVTELQKERDELLGISEDMNIGPYDNCTDCGRRMVWNDPGGNNPTWMCPRCVYERMMKAEKERDVLSSKITAWEKAEDEWRQERNELMAQVEKLTKEEAEGERWKRLAKMLYIILYKPSNPSEVDNASFLDLLGRTLGISHDEKKGEGCERFITAKEVADEGRTVAQVRDECPGTGWYRCKECVHYEKGE